MFEIILASSLKLHACKRGLQIKLMVCLHEGRILEWDKKKTHPATYKLKLIVKETVIYVVQTYPSYEWHIRFSKFHSSVQKTLTFHAVKISLCFARFIAELYKVMHYPIKINGICIYFLFNNFTNAIRQLF